MLKIKVVIVQVIVEVQGRQLTLALCYFVAKNDPSSRKSYGYVSGYL